MTLSVNASIALRALRAILYNTRSELGTSKRFKIATHTKKGASVGLSSTVINKLTRRKSCIMAMCIQQRDPIRTEEAMAPANENAKAWAAVCAASNAIACRSRARPKQERSMRCSAQNRVCVRESATVARATASAAVCAVVIANACALKSSTAGAAVCMAANATTCAPERATAAIAMACYAVCAVGIGRGRGGGDC